MRSKEGPEREEDCKDNVQLINSVNVRENCQFATRKKTCNFCERGIKLCEWMQNKHFPISYVSILNRVFFYLKIYRGYTSCYVINGVRSGPEGYSGFQTTGMIEGFFGFWAGTFLGVQNKERIRHSFHVSRDGIFLGVKSWYRDFLGVLFEALNIFSIVSVNWNLKKLPHLLLSGRGGL